MGIRHHYAPVDRAGNICWSDPGFRARLLAYNAYNRRIFERVHAEALAGRGVAISLTDCYRQTDYGEPIVALKSYVLSPFADEDRMQSILRHVLAARDDVDRDEAIPDNMARDHVARDDVA